MSDNNNHPWKIIPSNCFILPNGESIFHRNFPSNVSFNLEVSKLPPFYKEIEELWSEFCFQKIDTNSTSYSESLWYNSHIRINNETLFIREFHLAGINKVGDLYESDGKLKSFDQLSQNNLPKEMYFKWMQLIDAIPSCWKRFLMFHDQLTENSIAPESKFLIPVDNNVKVSCSKLTCKVIYSVLVKNNQTKPTSVSYWQQKLNKQLDNKCWEQIFLMPWKATIESNTRCFQFKTINNALFLNSQLHKFGLVDSPKCSASGGSRGVPFRSRGFGGCGCRRFVGFWPRFRLGVASRARCCGEMGARCLVGFLFGLLGIFRAVGGGRMGCAWLWVSLLWRLRRQ